MRLLPIVACVWMLSACGQQTPAHTLYRESATLPNARLHIATFDSAAGDAYNRENCLAAMSLFQAQRGAKVRYWCEKGRYRG